MIFRMPMSGLALCMALAWALPGWATAEIVRVATYNVENYLDVPEGTRRVKSPEARAKVVESILACKPDVIAMQEVGSTNALFELQSTLAGAGLKLPYWECVNGADTNIHVVILSRFELIARRPHTNESYLLGARRFRVSRGIAEVDVRVNRDNYFTLMATHLKSRNPSFKADESEMREQEALVVRQLVDARMAAAPGVGLVVAGDFNDRRDSAAVKSILGRGQNRLFDTHPPERCGSCPQNGAADAKGRTVAWTYYYSKEDTYMRIDYILVNSALKRRWVASESYVLSLPGWGVASDHRPVVCALELGE